MQIASLTAAALLALLSGQGPTETTPPAGPTSITGCLLVPGGSNLATSSDCSTCHASCASWRSHPVDVLLDGRRSARLRSSAEVVERGVFLADGKVTCLSCHDGNSTWRYKLAVPREAQLRLRANANDPGIRTNEAEALAPAPPAPPAGSDVSPTPLCKACHRFD